MFVGALLLLVLICGCRAEYYELVPGLEYLGTGYDITKGRPPPFFAFDPGFRSGVISHSMYPVVSVAGWWVPGGVDARTGFGCTGYENIYSSIDEETTRFDFSGSTDVAGEIEVEQVAENGTVIADRTSLSEYAFLPAWKGIKDTISGKALALFSLRTTCTTYFLGLRRYHAQDLSPQIMYALETLPSEIPMWLERQDISLLQSDDLGTIALHRFVQEFGTHVVSKLWMGGMRTTQFALSEDTMSRLESSGVDYDTLLGFALQDVRPDKRTVRLEGSEEDAGFLLAQFPGLEVEWSLWEEVRKATASRQDLTFGGYPLPIFFLESWSKTLRTLPAPVRVQVRPIWEWLERYARSVAEGSEEDERDEDPERELQLQRIRVLRAYIEHYIISSV